MYRYETVRNPHYPIRGEVLVLLPVLSYHETLHRNLLHVYVQVRCRLPEGEFLLYSAEAKIAEMLYPSASKLCVAMSWLSLVGMGALASPSFTEEE